MATNNLAVEILDDGKDLVVADGFGCCIYVYMYSGPIW